MTPITDISDSWGDVTDTCRKMETWHLKDVPTDLLECLNEELPFRFIDTDKSIEISSCNIVKPYATYSK